MSTFYAADGWVIQESLPTQWHLLVASVLLNQSRRTEKWDETLWTLFGKWSDAKALSEAGPELEELLRPHGFQNVKAKRLRKLSEGYISWDHRDPRQLYGVGEYAAWSWRIFVKGERPERVPDRALNDFLTRWHGGWRPGDSLIPPRHRRKKFRGGGASSRLARSLE